MKKEILYSILVGIICCFQYSDAQVLNPGNNFNPIGNYSNFGSKPTAVEQRMVAASLWFNEYNAAPSLVDSQRFNYSGYRGSFPDQQTGNIATVSQFDSSYKVAGLFTKNITGYAYTSIYYEGNGTTFYGYDSLYNLTSKQSITRFSNDSISDVKITFYYPSQMSFSETNYNENGVITRDSSIAFIYNGNTLLDSILYVKNIHFDNLSRIDYIDSTERAWENGILFDAIDLKTTNFYASQNDLFPQKDSVISISYHALNGIGITDTDYIISNQYEYNASNKLVQATLYQQLPSLSQQSNDTIYRDIYTYTSSNQLQTHIGQEYNYSSFENSYKEEYEYTQGINTLYTTYSYGSNNTWFEQNKTISILDNNNIIDSILVFQNQELSSLNTYSTNNYKNQSKSTSIAYLNATTPYFQYSYYYYYADYDDPTSIQPATETAYSYNIFPNPSENKLNYKVGNFQTDNAIFLIFDLSGKILIKKDIDRNIGEIDISTLNAGIYLSKITNDNGQSTKIIKFTKE